MRISSSEEFLKYYSRIRERTRRVISCIPQDEIDWTHREGAFTFGDLIRHLAAMERWMWAENAQRKPSLYPGCGRELADGYEEVMEYFERMHAESLAIFESLSPEALESRCATPGGAELPVWKWLRAMIEHEIHHRAQIYLMLGMLGVETPPLYGLTAEEVQQRSGGSHES